MLITTLVVSFCKDGGVSVSVKLWFLVVCVLCEVICRLVVLDNVILGSMCVGVLEFRCGLVRVVSVLQAESQVVLQPATRIPLQPNHTETPTHIEPSTIRPMW